jgi:hypothetical protein
LSPITCEAFALNRLTVQIIDDSVLDALLDIRPNNFSISIE